VVEQWPRMEGRQMVMVLSPKKKEAIVTKNKEIKEKEKEKEKGAGSNLAEELGGTKQNTKNLEPELKEEAKAVSEKL